MYAEKAVRKTVRELLYVCIYWYCVVSQPFQPHLNGCAMAIIFTNAKKYMRWKCFWQYPDLIIASFVTFNHIVYFLFVSSFLRRRFFEFNVFLFVFRQCSLNRKMVWMKKNSLRSYKIQQFSTVFRLHIHLHIYYLHRGLIFFFLSFFFMNTQYTFLIHNFTHFMQTLFLSSELIMNKERAREKRQKITKETKVFTISLYFFFCSGFQSYKLDNFIYKAHFQRQIPWIRLAAFFVVIRFHKMCKTVCERRAKTIESNFSTSM